MIPRVLNVAYGLQIHDSCVLVDRRTKWGNPFKDGTRDENCDRYEQWIVTQHHLIAALPELRGKHLMCHCAPKRCHADTLLRLANA